MNVLIAVVDDLWFFLRESLFGAVISQRQKGLASTLSLPGSTAQTQELEDFVEAIEHATQVTEASPAPLSRQSDALLHTGERYFIGGIDVFFYADPVIAFDNAFAMLSYGTSVQLLQIQGRWAQIRYDETIGWILKDSLCAKPIDVFPHFTTDTEYVHDHPETIKLRAFIGDAFGGARGMFALSAEEYVYYKLRKQNRQISWGTERSRIAGTWQRKLKGKQGVYIRVTPKTDAVMEYVIDDVGYLAFVEAVYPDNSVKVSEIASEENSVYREYTYTPEQWREFRPVFITIA